MDTVSKVGIQSSVLGPTHQSNPAVSTPATGAPHATTGNAEAQLHSKTEAAAAADAKDKGNAVDEFLKNLKIATTRLRISQDEALGIFVYQSVDPVSGKVMEQYPSEERLKQLNYLVELDSKKRGTTV